MIKKSDELKKFEEALSTDENLRKNYEAALKKIADEGTAKTDGEVMVKAANDLGFEISIEEMERLFAEMQELDEQELGEVAGGGCGYPSNVNIEKDSCPCDSTIQMAGHSEDESGHDGFCAMTWHCLGAFLHTDTDSKNVTCWKDYLCVFVNN